MSAKSILSNEATSVDLAVYDALKELNWTRGTTLHYQRSFALTPEQQEEFPGLKSIKPDFVLTDLQDVPLAVIENKERDPAAALTKLRLLYSRVLRPRFLYACVAGENNGALKIFLLDLEWSGLDVEFKAVPAFYPLDGIAKDVALAKQKKQAAPVKIDTCIAGGYDPAAGKERIYQLDCIKKLIGCYQEGKQKMLVHMATGLGKTRTVVALIRALFDAALAKRVLFVVDRRMLARQARDKGFALISGSYNSAWITSASLKSHAGKDIHIVVIDTLENIYDRLPPNYYDLLIVDECHRSITYNRKLIFDHFLCPRIGLTATPKIAVSSNPEKPLDPEDQAIADTYALFGCETKQPDYEFGMDRGIAEGFLAPYTKEEILTELTKEAMKEGITYDHLLDPVTRERINLTEEQKVAIDKLNKRILSEPQAQRWAQEIRAKTEHGEKVIVFAASQAHAQMLVKEINVAFNDETKEGYRYAEAVISENDELNDVIKASFERPYHNPRIVVSVDIMSTGVDVPCVRYIAFGALTQSVGKYIQMIGRGTRLDPKTGKFSFKVLDFVGLCAKMKDNGRGTPEPNEKIVKPGTGSGGGGGGGGGSGRVDGLLDNPDPAHLIQRTTIIDGQVTVIDNVPIAVARQLFEEGIKGTQDPLIAEITRKVWEHKDYEPTDEELTAIRDFVSKPNILLTEAQLQRIYGFAAGSVWDFFCAVLGVRTIPTKAEQLEAGYDQFLKLYPFTPEQVAVLGKIKDILAANIDDQGRIDLNAIFANPVYSRLLGRFEEINRLFEGRLRDVFAQLSSAFKVSA